MCTYIYYTYIHIYNIYIYIYIPPLNIYTFSMVMTSEFVSELGFTLSSPYIYMYLKSS